MGLARHPFGRGFTTALPNRRSGAACRADSLVKEVWRKSCKKSPFPTCAWQWTGAAISSARFETGFLETTRPAEIVRELGGVAPAPHLASHGHTPGPPGPWPGDMPRDCHVDEGVLCKSWQRVLRRQGVTVRPVFSVRRRLGMPTTLVDLANGRVQPVPQPVSEEVAGHNHQED